MPIHPDRVLNYKAKPLPNQSVKIDNYALRPGVTRRIVQKLTPEQELVQIEEQRLIEEKEALILMYQMQRDMPASFFKLGHVT